jgi:hypothetical protein
MRLRPRLSQRPSLTSGPLKKISAYSSWSSNGSDSPKKNGTSVRAKWVAKPPATSGDDGTHSLRAAELDFDRVAAEYRQTLFSSSPESPVSYDLPSCPHYIPSAVARTTPCIMNLSACNQHVTLSVSFPGFFAQDCSLESVIFRIWLCGHISFLYFPLT